MKLFNKQSSVEKLNHRSATRQKPEHLELGSRGENLQDQRDFNANGVDYSLLKQGVPLTPINTV